MYNFRTLPFDVFVRRAAEVKHKEYFISEVISFESQFLLSVILPVYGVDSDELQCSLTPVKHLILDLSVLCGLEPREKMWGLIFLGSNFVCV